MSDASTTISRRTFVKGMGALAAVGSATAATGTLFAAAPAQAAEPQEETVWTYCATDCTGCCSLRCHVVDGDIAYVETDDTGDPALGGIQCRACLKGRALRQYLGSPDRLDYPMKRVGARGEGKFERISWDEATTMIADELGRVQRTYGPEAVMAMTVWEYNNGIMLGLYPFKRLLNMSGGFINLRGGNYSEGQLFMSSIYTYGQQPFIASSIANMDYVDGQMALVWGWNPAEARAGGANLVHDFRHAIEKYHMEVIHIDPRYHNSVNDGEWIPIRPGTDAALVAGLVHVLITEDLLDLDYIHTYCEGFDEETLPAGAEPNSSYKAYVMGTGYDRVEKTPEWASKITQIPAERIVRLARQLAGAKRVYMTQGMGSARNANGEQMSRARMILAALLGQIGLPGTNAGVCQGWSAFGLERFPMGENPCKAEIQIAQWQDAVRRGHEFTATNAGLTGVDKLSTDIKLIFSYGSNILANQCADLNGTHELLKDESKVEFIVVSDIMMTPSCQYADLIIPDLSTQELLSITDTAASEDHKIAQFGKPVYAPKFERRDLYDVLADVARKMGFHDEYTDGGKTREDWLRALYEKSREKTPTLPAWDEAFENGPYKEEGTPFIVYEDFIADPAANPLETESGKVQIYSQKLAEMARTWELADDEVIYPVPVHDPAFNGYESLTDEYPLQLIGYHPINVSNSTYANVEAVRSASRHQLWINPRDAAARGIDNNDVVLVSNEFGRTLVEAKVTPRIIPGTVALPAGAWYDGSRGDGIEANGAVNVLTTPRVTPIAKSAPMMSNICQVEKFEER